MQNNYAQIEVWLLTGFLGSGKTTMLNALLNNEYFADKDTALVINEYGSIGIDSNLIQKQELPKYEINKGSIFCICTKTEFFKVFEQLRTNRPEIVIIEATGIAETSGIEQLLSEPMLENLFKTRCNICMVDAKNFVQTAAFLKTAVSQVEQADAVIINKIDLATANSLAQTQEIVTRLNPAAQIYKAEYGKVKSDFLTSICRQNKKSVISQNPPGKMPSSYIKTDIPLDKNVFFYTVEKLKKSILRLKGNIAFTDCNAFIEIAGQEIIVKPACQNMGNHTSFCVIGWEIEKQELTAAFEKCLYKAHQNQ